MKRAQTQSSASATSLSTTTTIRIDGQTSARVSFDLKFSGWDESNDFVSDFNQNDNESAPTSTDYDEPWFRTDRPEFLYGIDMNHNGTSIL